MWLLRRRSHSYIIVEAKAASEVSQSAACYRQASEMLLVLMRQTTAGCVRSGCIDRPAAFLDVGDLAVLVYNEGGTIGNAHLSDQDSILLGDLAHMVAEDGVASVQFLFPMLQGRREIGADCYDLGIILIEISNTRLVCGEFLGSATGEGGHEEGEHYNFFPAEIRELHGLVIGVGQSEVGGFVTDFKIGLRRGDLLGRKRGREYRAG
jgi:hypothetical protein